MFLFCDQQRLRYLRGASYIHKMFSQMWNLQSSDISLKISVGIIFYCGKWSSANHLMDAVYESLVSFWIYFNNDVLQRFNLIELWQRMWVPCSWSTLIPNSSCYWHCFVNHERYLWNSKRSNFRKMVGLGTFLLYITLCNLKDLYIIWSTNKVSLYYYSQSLIWLHLVSSIFIIILTFVLFTDSWSTFQLFNFSIRKVRLLTDLSYLCFCSFLWLMSGFAMWSHNACPQCSKPCVIFSSVYKKLSRSILLYIPQVLYIVPLFEWHIKINN